MRHKAYGNIEDMNEFLYFKNVCITLLHIKNITVLLGFMILRNLFLNHILI